MSTKKQNVQLFDRVNGWLHSIDPATGRYQRDRIFQSLGIAPGKDGDYGRNFGLSDQQRKQVQAAIEKELGFKFQGGIEIDSAANVNENEGLGKQVKKWGPIVGGAAAAAFGVPGLFPGLLNAGGAAAAAAPTVNGISSALPGVITSQGVSAGIGAGAAGAAGTAAGVGGAIKAGLSTADVVRDVLKAGGSALGSAADTSAHNRGVKLDAAAAQEQLDQQRQMNRSDLTRDAWKAAQQASYVGSADRGKVPGVAGQYSRNLNLPPLDPALIAARAAEAKRTLQNDPGAFAFDPSLLNPGKGERAMEIGSAVAGVASALPPSFFKRLGKWIF